MNIPGNGLGRFGLAGLTLAGMAAIWWGITRYGGMLNINTRGEQVLAFVLVCLALVFVFYLPAMSRRVKESLYRRQSQQASVLPGEEGRVALTPPHHITVGEIRQTLRYQYGRAWSRKVRILLIIGSVRDVEQLTPKLTQELWQEDQGTLLLWGGDPGAAVDNAWFTALRKLRYRPADGMVWVTSGFEGVLTTMNRTKPRLTPDEMDSVSHSLKLRFEALGWKLPLYVWSLYEWGNEKNGRRLARLRWCISTSYKDWLKVVGSDTAPRDGGCSSHQPIMTCSKRALVRQWVSVSSSSAIPPSGRSRSSAIWLSAPSSSITAMLLSRAAISN